MSNIIDLFNSENEMHDINITCMCKTNTGIHLSMPSVVDARPLMPKRNLLQVQIERESQGGTLPARGVRPVCLSLVQTPVSVTQLPSPVEETLELLGQKEGGVHAVLDPPKS